ncbi:MAG: hypothetical protein ACXWJ7_14005 [Caldimonas sp.]
MNEAEELLAELDAALAAADSPEQALARVGRPPWIDSGTSAGLNALRMADFAPDPRAAQDFVDPHRSARVMYWGMPGGTGVNIAGLLWDAQRRARRFRAQVLAP